MWRSLSFVLYVGSSSVLDFPQIGLEPHQDTLRAAIQDCVHSCVHSSLLSAITLLHDAGMMMA